MKLSRALRLSAGDVVALTGGGGKTTTMFRLAEELANHPSKKMRVLTTTSTRILVGQILHAAAHVVFNPAESLVDILTRLDDALAKYNQVLLTGSIDIELNKAMGVPIKLIDALADSGRVGVIIVEADGARERPFKAPAEHEPVIPTRTTIAVPMVGLDVVGQPLNDGYVHRAALVSALSGTNLGEPVTVSTVTAVLSHPQGGLKHIPSTARVIPLLNKAEGPASLATGRELAAELLACGRIEAVAIGAVQTAKDPIVEVYGRTAAIILAAGGSTRFGSAKQLARWGQKTFIESVVDVALAARAQPVVVVLGAEAERCRAALGNRPVEVVVNEAWAEGQSTSMKAGLAALPPNISSAIFLLVDLPGITPEVVGKLVQRHRQTLAPIVWPEYEGQRGNPVLFDRRLFPQLRQISGDTGGRPLVLAYQDQAERVQVQNRAILQDFDRPEDLVEIS